MSGTGVHRQLIEEGYRISASTIRGYLREKRRKKLETFVPLVHRPGDKAQVNFFEVTVDINGERPKAYPFLMRLMYSGRNFVWIYERCDQVSFLDGHQRAFAHLGAVPRRCIYDNLKAAVKKVLLPERLLTDRFKALVSHYVYEPCFARPGEGHDKRGARREGKGYACRI